MQRLSKIKCKNSTGFNDTVSWFHMEDFAQSLHEKKIFSTLGKETMLVKPSNTNTARYITTKIALRTIWVTIHVDTA